MSDSFKKKLVVWPFLLWVKFKLIQKLMWRVKTWNCTAWKILVKKTGNLADKFNNGKWLGTESSESSSFLASSWAALTKMLLLSEHICLSWSLTTFRWFFTHVFGTHCVQPQLENFSKKEAKMSLLHTVNPRFFFTGGCFLPLDAVSLICDRTWGTGYYLTLYPVTTRGTGMLTTGLLG